MGGEGRRGRKAVEMVLSIRKIIVFFRSSMGKNHGFSVFSS